MTTKREAYEIPDDLRAVGWVMRPATVNVQGVQSDPILARGNMRGGFEYAETIEEARLIDAATDGLI